MTSPQETKFVRLAVNRPKLLVNALFHCHGSSKFEKKEKGRETATTLRCGTVFFLGAELSLVRSSIHVCDGPPFGGYVRMSGAIREYHVRGNNDLSTAADALVNSKLPINFSVTWHANLSR